jgi:predicted O-methyltransferase YrrM
LHIAPSLVQEAERLAIRLGFTRSSIPEVGRLLRVLAAGPGLAVGEIGTGAGVGAAWVLDGLHSTSSFVTVEIEPHLVKATRSLFKGQRIEVLKGDWREVLPGRGPFDVLFADGGGWKRRVDAEGPLLLSLMKAGGLIVMDDMTPERLWPDEWRKHGDPVRNFFFEHPLLLVAEILTTPSTAALIAAVR